MLQKLLTAFVGKREQYFYPCVVGNLAYWARKSPSVGSSFVLEYLNGNIWFPLGAPTGTPLLLARMYTPLCLHVHPPWET